MGSVALADEAFLYGDRLNRAEPCPDALRTLAARLGHRFADPELLRLALTHPSVTKGRAKRRFSAYERLEFLGDRVLGLAVAELLFQSYPQEPEGDLAKRHVALVRRETLAVVAKAIGLDAALLLSPGEESGGGRSNPSLLADACEALVGALFIDGGFAVASAFVRTEWLALMDGMTGPPRDAKTSLQEWAQGAGLPLPAYRVVGQDGPPHEPIFIIEAEVRGYPPVTGHGPSKRAAEQDAATQLLETIKS